MAETQDVETLKRRGRRRLVGAIALVLAAVIVLPMVFDAEPRRAPPVSVRIPGEDDPAFTPKVVPKAAVPQSAPETKAPVAKVEPKPEPVPAPKEPRVEPKPKPEPKPEAMAEPKPKPAPPPVPSDAERKRAEAALAGAGQAFIVPVAALASPEKLKELTDSLGEAKVPHFTEPIATAKGTVTRVRAGPFATREAAEQALAKLKGMGLKPGNIGTRP
ncbi:MAG: hypothetical protein EXR31_09020 [Betaproteobacteria bacterium]|nr:hypothetical protein [Betaproteobacteria bacterium]